MARKDKYNRTKPKVSPITLMIVGLVFLAIILTIVFSIDTPKQKFDKVNGLEDNVYKLTSFKKVNKKIEAGEDVIVVINLKTSESSPAQLLNNVNDAFLKQNKFEKKEEVEATDETTKVMKNDVSNYVDVIYYVTIKDASVIEDFLEKHDDIKANGFPLLLTFKNKEFKVQYEDIKNKDELDNPEALPFRNTELFFHKTTEAFETK